MERLIEMLVIIGLLYAGYALTLQKWTYVAQADWEKRKNVLKTKGLTNTFYFINARTQFILTLLSGGLFTFFWLYRQWSAVLKGFRRLEGGPLRFGPLLRTLGGFVTFFSLGGIMNRTCEYMRKKPALPAGVWGLLWLGGLGAVFAPVSAGWRITGYILFCAAPVAFQRRLNALPKQEPSAWPKIIELLAAAAGSAVMFAGLFCLRQKGLL